jgi:hypothetical protein
VEKKIKINDEMGKLKQKKTFQTISRQLQIIRTRQKGTVIILKLIYASLEGIDVDAPSSIIFKVVIEKRYHRERTLKWKQSS